MNHFPLQDIGIGGKVAGCTLSRSCSPPTPRILVVDDEPVVRDLLGEILGTAGYKVDLAPDGAEALDLVRHNDYSLLIADVRMPKMDGFEFYRAARVEVKFIPVLFITGLYDPDIPRKATELGARGFLYKPFQVEEIVREVENLMERSASGNGGTEIPGVNSPSVPIFRNAGRGYGALVETMEEGVVVLDSRGVIQFTNRRFLRILGCAPAELMGKRFSDLAASPEQREDLKQAATRLGPGKTMDYETTLRTGTRKVPVRVHHTHTNEEDAGSLLVVTDLGPFQEAETLNRKLGEGFHRKVQQLAAVQTKIQRLKHSRAELFALLRNELQSALAGITASLEAMDRSEVLSPSQRRILHQALQQSSRTNDILGRILKLEGLE